MSTKGKRWSWKTHKDASPKGDYKREYYRMYRQGVRNGKVGRPSKGTYKRPQKKLTGYLPIKKYAWDRT